MCLHGTLCVYANTCLLKTFTWATETAVGNYLPSSAAVNQHQEETDIDNAISKLVVDITTGGSNPVKAAAQKTLLYKL